MKKIFSLLALLCCSIAAWAQMPQFSNADEEHYYYIKANIGDIYLADKGLGKAVRTDGLAVDPAMQWKFVGTQSNCQIVNKLGHYMWLGGAAISANGNSEGEAGSGGGNNDKPLRTQEGEWSKGFKLANHSASGCFSITPNDQANGYGFNVWGGNGSGKTIGLWQNSDPNNAFLVKAIESVKAGEFSYTPGQRPADISPLSLWYDFPATATSCSNKWMEYGLPIGNGRIGAVLNGGILREEIQFNEKTLYNGTPTDFTNTEPKHGHYANFGWIYADDLSGAFDKDGIKDYARYLDIERGVAGVNYASASGTKYTRTFFTTAVLNTLVARYTAEGGSDKLHLLFTLNPDGNINAKNLKYENGWAKFEGKSKTVTYGCQMCIHSTDGEVVTTNEGIEVKGATEIVLCMSADTNFDIKNKSCVNGTQAEVNDGITLDLGVALDNSYDKLLAEHVNNFSGYMNRVSLQLGNAASQLTTNKLIDNYATASKRNTPDGLFLEQLYFQYGRYLEVSCNNLFVAVPSNLQGIWNNNSKTDFWHCDVHTDINVQMNYWPAESTNLSEMHLPFLHNIIWLSGDDRNFHTVAQNYKKGARGWMCTTECNIFGGCSSWEWDHIKTLAAWNCHHLFQHYRYTLDRDFLKEALPTMVRAAQFIIDITKGKNSDGTLYVENEYSPEHGDAGYSTAFAQQNSTDVMRNVLEAAAILGDECPVDAMDIEEIRGFYDKIDHGLHTESYNGKTCLKEWAEKPLNWKGDAASHRHLSHLMALFPYGHVTPYTTIPEDRKLFDAAVNSLAVRNATDVTGWSAGHKVNLHARALEGDKAHDVFSLMFHHSQSYEVKMQGAGGCYYNLWDAHAPFQIDGNFGYCSGVAEMLLQSYDGTIHLLPALPKVWGSGSVKGLKAVGNFTVSVDWADNKPTVATIESVKGARMLVDARGIDLTSVQVRNQNGQGVAVYALDGSCGYEIEAAEGDVITIDFTKPADSVVGIKQADNTTASAATYDLQGRSTKRAEGIIIKDGKKQLR